MAKQVIDLGTPDNPATGDSLRNGGGKINGNFNDLYLKIDGFNVDYTDKTDLDNWEVNDKFRGWIGNDRFVEGVVVGLPFDIDDKTKVKLAVDNLI